MKKFLILTLCVLLALPAFSMAEDSKVLHLMTWETYIDDETVAAFEQETGIDVIYTPMEYNEDILFKLNESGGAGFDLVLGSDYMLDILRKEELIQKLDLSALSNYNNLDENYLGKFYDEENEYVIPYMSGSPLIVYDPAKVDFEITGYEDLWNEKLVDSIAMIDDARVVVGITLKSMGKSFNETDPEVLAQAKEKLMPLYKNIRGLDYSSLQTMIVGGEASVGFMFTSQVFLALMERPDLKVVEPKEGLGIGIDGLAIPSKAENVQNAHLFLDYLMRPEVAAHNAMWQGYACVNKAAAPQLTEDYTNNPAVKVSPEMVQTAEFIQDIGETATIFQEIFTEFKLQ